MFETVSLCAIIFVAAFFSGLSGFGFALIALPLLTFFLDLQTIVPLMVMLGVSTSLTNTILLRRSILFGKIGLLMAGALAGTPAGAYCLGHVPAHWLGMGLGAVMVAAMGYQFWAKPEPRRLGFAPTILAGGVSGLLSGSIGAAGPPVIVYSSIQPWTKDQSKGVMACYFTLVGIYTLIMFIATGLATSKALSLYPLLLPALALGLFLGGRLYARITDHGYRKMVLAMVFVLGWVMIVKYFPV